MPDFVVSSLLKAFNFVSGPKRSYCLTIYMPHDSLVYHINLHSRHHGQKKMPCTSLNFHVDKKNQRSKKVIYLYCEFEEMIFSNVIQSNLLKKKK